MEFRLDNLVAGDYHAFQCMLRVEQGMVKSKGKKSAGPSPHGLLSSGFDSVVLGILIVVPDEDRHVVRLASRHLEEILHIPVAGLRGKEQSIFWDQLISRLRNPHAMRDDLARITGNRHELRTDVLHLFAPEAAVLERDTAPILSARGHYLGRMWTFRNVDREFKLREELQRKRKTEYCFRTLSSFLFEASLSARSLSEVCRIACQGLDVVSVVFVPMRAQERQSAQFAVSRQFRLEAHEADVVTYARRALERGRGVPEGEVWDIEELGPGEAQPFLARGVARLMLVPVTSDHEPWGLLVMEEAHNGRDWSREDFRCAQSVARALGLWFRKEENERALIRAREEAEAAARVRTDFIALLSHELRTPLNPLIGFTQLLQEQGDELNSECRDMVGRIADGANRLRELVEDLLTLTRLDSRLDGWRKYHCDPGGIVKDCSAQASRNAADKEVEVEVSLGSNLGIVEADGAALRRALCALLSNAVRYSPVKGLISVSVESSQGCLLIRIADQGPGIADDSKRKIFEPFVQGEPVLTRRHGGAGIGLTLVRRVAESHEGRVWVEDGPRGGSVFFLELPHSNVDMNNEA